MKLGEKIMYLRKQKGYSQEQLGEKINVTRQTISNWELQETSPNPEQLKLLSKVLNVSIDELLDNDIKLVLEDKISNTEKLAGMIIKILKILGILFVFMLVIDIIALITFNCISSVKVEKSSSIELSCKIKDDNYTISVGTDGNFECANCSKGLKDELKNKYIDFNSLEKTEENITNYFENNNGLCD